MKKIFSLMFVLVMILSSFSISFAETNIYDNRNGHPFGQYRVVVEENETDESENNRDGVPFVTVYYYDYTINAFTYGAWRNGASGGSNVSASTLIFDYRYNESYNIKFVASVTGEYTQGDVIGAHLGVELGRE